MDFKAANELADRFIREESESIYQQLVKMCIPYLLFVKDRFGFFCVTARDVVNELASDAVFDAITAKSKRNLPFTICLQNTFRDCCRKRIRIIREHAKEGFLTKCEIRNPPTVIGVGPRRPSVELQVQREEEKQLFRDELERHGPFSRKLIYQRMRGSTFPEMVRIFETPFNECKNIYWHDINNIRDELRQRYVEEEN